MTSPARFTIPSLALWLLALAGTGSAQSLLEDDASRLRLPPDTPFAPLDGEEPNESYVDRLPEEITLPRRTGAVTELLPPARVGSLPSAPVSMPMFQPQPALAPAPQLPMQHAMQPGMQPSMQTSMPYDMQPGMQSGMQTGVQTGVPQPYYPHAAGYAGAQLSSQSGHPMGLSGAGLDTPLVADPNCVAPGAVSGLGVRPVTFNPESFLQTPFSPVPYDPAEELATYRQRYAVPVQRPWVEFWRPFYTSGIYPPANDFFGKTNLLFPHFYVYGDYRTGVGINRNQAGDTRSWAHRLNLDMDLGLTATERIHGFMGPLDKNNQFTRLDFTNSAEIVTVTDVKFDTLYFEGDLGSIAGGFSGNDSAFDLPVTFGLVPLLYQNGIWMEDAVLGGAVAIPARHSSDLQWANFDATFFAVGDQLTSDAFKGSNSAAEALGTAWFIDAYDGYIELDYAYVHDDVGQNRSYNNFAVAFTRRYLMNLSNSVRLLTNFGQDLPEAQRTADGYLIIVENSLISPLPNRLVPYCNMWYGSGRPQSVARAGGSGGILRNTGINFETDGLTGYPTLDPTAANTYGAAVGANMLGPNFRDQIVLEAAALNTYGSSAFRRVAGDQYALGIRYQRPLSHRWIFRADSMVGFLRNAEDIYGNRVELRWKF